MNPIAILWIGIVLHHTATPALTTVESIRRHHIDVNKWDDIGYHYLVDYKGVVHKGRPTWKQGAHARGRNATHLGVALIGTAPDFTEAQLQGLRDLIANLQRKHPTIKSIEPHHDKCPGVAIEELLK